MTRYFTPAPWGQGWLATIPSRITWLRTELTDALIAYFSETLLRNNAQASWGGGWDEEAGESYVYHGQPVIVGLHTVDAHPWSLMANTVGGIWDGTADSTDLFQLYRICTERRT